MTLAPFQVDFDITLGCMYKCKHCNVDAGEKLSNEMSTSEIKKVLDELDEIGVSDISITGGEPLLRKDCMEILEYAHKKPGFYLTLNTNGLLLNEKIIKELELKCPQINIAISLDGYDPETYSILRKDINNKERILVDEFNIIKKNLEVLKNSSLSVGINYTATKTTIENVWKTYEYINSLGFNRMLVIKFFPFGQGLIYKEELELDYDTWKGFLIKATELKMSSSSYKGLKVSTTCPWEMYLPLLKNYDKETVQKVWDYNSPLETELYSRNRDVGCHAGITSCAISPNGDLYPCGTISSKYPDFVCGNLKIQSLEDIWYNSPKLKEFRDIKLSKLKGNCNDCDLSKLCGGGCRARAYTTYGSLYSEDYLCPNNSVKGEQL